MSGFMLWMYLWQLIFLSMTNRNELSDSNRFVLWCDKLLFVVYIFIALFSGGANFIISTKFFLTIYMNYQDIPWSGIGFFTLTLFVNTSVQFIIRLDLFCAVKFIYDNITRKGVYLYFMIQIVSRDYTIRISSFEMTGFAEGIDSKENLEKHRSTKCDISRNILRLVGECL